MQAIIQTMLRHGRAGADKKEPLDIRTVLNEFNTSILDVCDANVGVSLPLVASLVFLLRKTPRS